MTLDEVKTLVAERGIEFFLCSFVEMAGAPKAKGGADDTYRRHGGRGCWLRRVCGRRNGTGTTRSGHGKPSRL